MERRGFLKLMVGGVAAAAAVRTFPFRVFSFPNAPYGINENLITGDTLISQFKNGRAQRVSNRLYRIVQQIALAGVPEHYEITVAGRPDLPLLGEFPSHGQYERQFFYLDEKCEKHETFPTMPGESWMERAIQHHEHSLAKKADESPNVEWRIQDIINRSLEEIKAARDHYEQQSRAEFDAKIKDRISPIFSNSLAGGRFREELAQRCRALGMKIGHVGN